jgi:TrmH family RNA methyltransferase
MVKIFAEAERRFCTAQAESSAGFADHDTGEINGPPHDWPHLNICAGAADLLAADGEFAAPAAAAFSAAALVFRQPDSAAAVRRALNTVRHLLLAETGRSPADWDFIDDLGRLDPARRRPFPGMAVYLEDIRSPFNVGAMFRTAESFGAEKILLSPFCADPRHPRAARSAMGCVEALPWERRELFVEPQDENPGPVFALETGGVPLGKFPFPPQGLLIAGSEELGVSPRALAAADASLGRVSIPCYGAKGSLNVSVAFGIVMQAWAEALRAFSSSMNPEN